MRFILIILLNILSGFSSEFSDLKKNNPLSVFEKELRVPFLSSHQVQKIAAGISLSDILKIEDNLDPSDFL